MGATESIGVETPSWVCFEEKTQYRAKGCLWVLPVALVNKLLPWHPPAVTPYFWDRPDKFFLQQKCDEWVRGAPENIARRYRINS